MISACGRFRYALWRHWSARPSLLFVGYNPSTADALADDPTVARCVGFAQRARAGGLELVNLYALRAAQPGAVRCAEDPVGPEGDAYLLDALGRCEPLVVAWGSLARRPADLARIALVGAAARALGRTLLCLGTTRTGAPRHPLYVRSSRSLEVWRGP